VGQSWAAIFAINGYEVILHDLSDKVLSHAKKRVKNHMDTLINAGIGINVDYKTSGIETTTDLKKALRDADFVQESVFESYNVKKPLYSEMDEIAQEHVIFSSSTSGLLMTEIQMDMKLHPERSIVAHPWNPAHLVPLVEICPGIKTSKSTIDRTCQLMEDINKVPIVLKKEIEGFIANRLSAALWREALDLVDKGVATVEDVDTAIKAGPGMRWAIMGPYLTYHLGGGKGGIEYLMRHIGVRKADWLETMAKWTVTPESAITKAINGVNDMVGQNTTEELERWRDEHLISLYNLLWVKK